MNEEAKKLISEAKHICIIPSQNGEPESLCTALALFYTLKELGKNVNVIIGAIPEKLNFLAPSLDFITEPKNFVVSIPRTTADISQIYYEKSDSHLKIHLTVNRGRLKKDDVAFYVEDAKPDAIITLGIKNLHHELLAKLDSFGFLLDSPIINIDSEIAGARETLAGQQNTRFGKINIIQEAPLPRILFDTITALDSRFPSQAAAQALLAGLVMHYENFKSPATSPDAFALASELIKRGGDYQKIVENIYQASEAELVFVGQILQTMTSVDGSVKTAIFDVQNFEQFSEREASVAVEKIGTLGITQNLLVLWKSRNSAPATKGFFWSREPRTINKLAEYQYGSIKQGWVFLDIPNEDMQTAKAELLGLLR